MESDELRIWAAARSVLADLVRGRSRGTRNSTPSRIAIEGTRIVDYFRSIRCVEPSCSQIAQSDLRVLALRRVEDAYAH